MHFKTTFACPLLVTTLPCTPHPGGSVGGGGRLDWPFAGLLGLLLTRNTRHPWNRQNTVLA